MPLINISVAGKTLTEPQTNRLCQETTRLMHTIMRKKPELTAVCVDEIPASRWSIGSQIMGDRGVATASVIIHVTAGTNTADEKAQMIRATFQLLQAVLGSMAEASYVIIHELPAEAWGYGGQTQKARQAIKVA